MGRLLVGVAGTLFGTAPFAEADAQSNPESNAVRIFSS